MPKQCINMKTKCFPKCLITISKNLPIIIIPDFLPPKIILLWFVSHLPKRSLLKYIGPKVWANIPLSIKSAPSLKVFINFYRNHLIGNFEF